MEEAGRNVTRIKKGIADGLDPFYKEFPSNWFAKCEVYPNCSVRFEYGQMVKPDRHSGRGWERVNQISVFINPEGIINWFVDESKMGLVEKVIPEVKWEKGGLLSVRDLEELNKYFYNGFFQHLTVMESCKGKKVTRVSELRKKIGKWIMGK